QLARHDPVTLCGIVNITRNKQALVPVLMRILFSEECRKQVDEFFAIATAEVSPHGYVAAVAVIMGELPMTWVHCDNQSDTTASQQVGKGLHILQGARDTALQAEWLKNRTPRAFLRKGPVDCLNIHIKGLARVGSVTPLRNLCLD